MKIHKLRDTSNYYILDPPDDTGRDIGYSIIENAIITGRNSFYPNCLLYNNDILLSPYDESVMSLKKDSFYDNDEYDILLHEYKNDTITRNDVFFFIYNFDNYYHFIYDTISMLYTFYKLRQSISGLKLLVNYPNPTMNKFYNFNEDILYRLVDKNDIIIYNTSAIYNKIYIPTSLTHGGYSNNPPRKEIFNIYNLLINSVNNSNIRPQYKNLQNVYISRRTYINNDSSNIGTNYTSRRKMINEDKLVQELTKMGNPFGVSGNSENSGFFEVFLESLNMDEKLHIFMNAKHIVGSIGGGMANLLFSNKTTTSYVIMTPEFLKINYRFKYSLEQSRVVYFGLGNVSTYIEHVNQKIPLYTRVIVNNKIGEICDYCDNKYLVNISNNDVAGFNNSIEFTQEYLHEDDFKVLDNGLNSPYTVDIPKLLTVISYQDIKSIGILLIGLPRCINECINKYRTIYHEFDLRFYLVTSGDIEHHNDLYKTLIVSHEYNNNFRNSLNYTYKLCNGLDLLDIHDMYIVSRTDLIIESLPIINMSRDMLYFSDKDINQYTRDITNKISENIIIARDLNTLKLLKPFHEYNLHNENYVNINLYRYIVGTTYRSNNQIKYSIFNTDYHIILSKCNIIAISGDSGSGKSTLLKTLLPLIDDKDKLVLETDRYHKWERGNDKYNEYTHLNPVANRLEKMKQDIYNLHIGKEIYEVDYDHTHGIFTQKEKIESKNNIFICGLHTLYFHDINKMYNLKIFMDTDRALIKQWKINRDVNIRGHSLDNVLKQIDKRENDYKTYIENQKHNADMIINFHTEGCCIYIIKELMDKVLAYLIKNKYDIEYTDYIKFELINNYEIILDDFYNNYYRQIYVLVSLLIN